MRRLWLLPTLVAVVAGPAEAQAPAYDIVHLGALSSNPPTTSTATAINSRGLVVGFVRYGAGGADQPVAWDLNRVGHRVTLGLPLDSCTGLCLLRRGYALGVNDHDQIVGYRLTQLSQSTEATFWSGPGQVPQLRADSISWGVNNESVVVGTRSALAVPDEAYRLHWDPARDGRLLAAGIPRSTARAVNEVGDTGGAVITNANPNWTPYLYRGWNASRGAYEPLPLPAGSNSGTVLALSNDHRAAGTAQTAAGLKHAVLWYRGIFAWSLRTLDGSAADSEALGMNDRGQVVGYLSGTGAMLWAGGSATRLEGLLPAAAQTDWDLLEARDINNRGEIVGIGNYRGVRHAFLLTPQRTFEIRVVPGAAALNDDGWLAGEMPVSGGTASALWAPGATQPTALGTLGSSAFDLNDTKQVAGFQSPYDAVLWQPPPTLFPVWDLPAPAIGTPVAAAGVSNSGHAVGWSNRFVTSALFWNPNGGVLEPLAPERSQFLRVNDSGHAVGVYFGVGFQPRRYSARRGVERLQFGAILYDVDSRGVAVGTKDPTPAAFAWAPGATTTTGLGALESDINGSNSGANGINDRREIVGTHRANRTSLGPPAAFLWQQGAMMDLNLLIPEGTPWQLSSGVDVNDAGQVLGNGYTPPGSSSLSRFVLTLPGEADEAIRLCQGWCQPIQGCAPGQDPTLWRRANYDDWTNRFGSCMNGCLAAMPPHVTSPSRTLAQEFAVRECTLAAVPVANRCTADWSVPARSCCQNLGLADCTSYFP